MAEQESLDSITSKHPSVPPWGDVFLSYHVPGLGQIAAGRKVSGAIFACVFVVGVCITGWFTVSPRYPGFKAAAMALVVVIVVWLWNIIHAYRAASKTHDREQDRPWIAAFLSGLVVGLGQFFNRDWIGGLCFMGLRIGAEFTPMIVAVPLVVVLGFWSPIAAFRSALSRAPDTRQDVRLVVLALMGQLCLVAVLALTLRSIIVQPFKVPTGAMAPTILGITQLSDGRTTVGDHIFVDKWTYRCRPPRRGEIVVFRTDFIKDIPEKVRGKYWVKRIVGLPGERLSIRPPFLYVNGERVNEPPVLQKIQQQQGGYGGYVLGVLPRAKFLARETDSVQLGADDYFVLGDNSRSSLDSRYWGPVPREAIVGRVTKIYWPAGRVGTVE